MREGKMAFVLSLASETLIVVGLVIGFVATVAWPVLGSAVALIVAGYAGGRLPTATRAAALSLGTLIGVMIPIAVSFGSSFGFWGLVGLTIVALFFLVTSYGISQVFLRHSKSDPNGLH